MITITHTIKNEYENFVTMCKNCGAFDIIAQRKQNKVREWYICSFCDKDISDYDYKLMKNVKLRLIYHTTP